MENTNIDLELLTPTELKKLQERKEKLLEKQRQEEELKKRNSEVKNSFKSFVEDGFPIHIGDRALSVYKIYDEESLRLLGKTKNDQNYLFIGVDRKTKSFEKSLKERMILELCDEEVKECLPLQKNGKVDAKEALAQVPYCKIDFLLDKPFEYTEDKLKRFNLYVPPPYLTLAETKDVDIKNFISFMEHLFPVKNERESVYSYLKQSLVSRCRSKVLFLVGPQGIGKGFLYMAVIKPLFPEGVVEKLGPRALSRQFLPNLKIKRFLFIDEVVLTEGSVERSQLRALTEDEVATEQKFQNEKIEASNTSFMLSSNEISHLSFNSTERRPFVPTLTETPLDQKFSNKFLEDLKESFKDDKYKKAVFDFLNKHPDLPTGKIVTGYFETICLNSAPQLCHEILISVFKGEYNHLTVGNYYHIKSFFKGNGNKQGRMKDATVCTYLANFTWNKKHFFKYNRKKASCLKWLGVDEKVIEEYKKDLVLDIEDLDDEDSNL